MKTKEELNVLKADVEALSKRLGELSADGPRMVSGGTAEAFDKAQTEILMLISEALANNWARERFQFEAENVIRNTPGLDLSDILTLDQLIFSLLSQLPA